MPRLEGRPQQRRLHGQGINEPCKETLNDGRVCGLKHNRLIHRTNISGVNVVHVHNIKVLDRDSSVITSIHYNYNCTTKYPI